MGLAESNVFHSQTDRAFELGHTRDTLEGVRMSIAHQRYPLSKAA